ncbi:hypothetical protein [Streptomyces sp. Z26]|uniref:hypothetical protein n=1 Tax=Streptomyces sp. Z26 TaxID=2500177 RepID=UPI000EF153C8|nr:hypothetical protein [Streptomyces sp. Z26]RLL66956.1 hypothetical protein D7M15_08845 [Streptomyces sp. Z26]
MAETRTLSLRFQRTTLLPDGEILTVIEQSGRLDFAVHPDHASDELCAALNRFAEHLGRHGKLTQNWDDATTPPQTRRAS